MHKWRGQSPASPHFLGKSPGLTCAPGPPPAWEGARAWGCLVSNPSCCLSLGITQSPVQAERTGMGLPGNIPEVRVHLTRFGPVDRGASLLHAVVPGPRGRSQQGLPSWLLLSYTCGWEQSLCLPGSQWLPLPQDLRFLSGKRWEQRPHYGDLALLCFSHTSTQADRGRHATGHFVCNTYICFFFPHTFAFNGRGKKREILVANVSKDRGQRCPRPGLPLPSSRATLVSGQAAAQRMLPVSESR